MFYTVLMGDVARCHIFVWSLNKTDGSWIRLGTIIGYFFTITCTLILPSVATQAWLAS